MTITVDVRKQVLTMRYDDIHLVSTIVSHVVPIKHVTAQCGSYTMQ